MVTVVETEDSSEPLELPESVLEHGMVRSDSNQGTAAAAMVCESVGYSGESLG